MVLRDITHWILHKICSSVGPWADTYFDVFTEFEVIEKVQFLLVILANKLKCAQHLKWPIDTLPTTIQITFAYRSCQNQYSVDSGMLGMVKIP